MAKLPILVYPAAFAGSLVLGRFVRSGGASTGAGGAEPMRQAGGTTNEDSLSGWEGYDGSGLQFPPGSGGVLPAPIDDGWWMPDPAPGVVVPTPVTPAPKAPDVTIPSQPTTPLRIYARPSATPPSGAIGWILLLSGSPVYDAVGGWNGNYPVNATGPRIVTGTSPRWVSGERQARLRNGRIVSVRRISNPSSAAWTNSFIAASGTPIYPPTQATVSR